ncbi:MAG: gamma-glutamylcyclotransferase [Aigarchaeota archaeon]|nr:gamma-glutamylcyclotransferase [Aigarchaeota archaeon]MDW8092395.1 gamma-glutamylcyclotransferase family protein [Nitrososphaerota archaeon]
MVAYFAYGATLNPQYMKRIVTGWTYMRRATLEGYRLVFDAYSPSWRGGVAGIREETNSVVYGVVYLIHDEDLKSLDKYEGVPNTRARSRVTLQMDDTYLNGITHNTINPRPYVVPSKEYVAELLKGLKAVGYDEEVVKRVSDYIKSLKPT